VVTKDGEVIYADRQLMLFAKDVLTRVPEFERDVTGLPMIERMADALFGESV